MSKVEDIIAASKLSELMNKKEEDETIIRIVVLVASILLMKIGKEYLGMILFALFVINDIILIIKNYLNKWRND